MLFRVAMIFCRIFELALEKASVEAAKAIHIGDSYVSQSRLLYCYDTLAGVFALPSLLSCITISTL